MASPQETVGRRSVLLLAGDVYRVLLLHSYIAGGETGRFFFLTNGTAESEHQTAAVGSVASREGVNARMASEDLLDDDVFIMLG